MAWCSWSTLCSYRMCFNRHLLSLHAAHLWEIDGPDLESIVQMWLLSSIWSLADTFSWSSATSSCQRTGIWKNLLEKERKKVRTEYLGDVCLSTVIRLRLTLCVGVSLQSSLPLLLTFPKPPGWGSGLTLYIYVITSPSSGVREG